GPGARRSLPACGRRDSPATWPAPDHQSLLQAADGIPFLPECFQECLEAGGILAQGAHGNLLCLRVIPKTQKGGADAFAALVGYEVAKFLVLSIRDRFLFGQS